jgi:hypothetical protein
VETTYGIEVEIEGLVTETVFFKYWEAVTDGSLRGFDEGIPFEFRFKQGYSLEESVKALDELDNYINKYYDNIVPSDRCSVHVHIGIRDLEWTSELIGSTIKKYLFSEELLFKIAGYGRRNSSYCVPLAHELLSIFEDSRGFYNKIGKMEHGRYYALNLLSIPKHNTIEFRHFRGTKNIYLIKEWLNLLERFMRADVDYTSVDSIKESLLKIATKKYSKFIDSNDIELKLNLIRDL